jgi:hypothetical protein
MPVTSPPTFAQACSRWGAEVNRLQKVRLLANANASPANNLVDLDRTAQQTTTVDGADAAGLEATRSTLRNAFNTVLASAATMLTFVVHQIASSAQILSGASTFLGLLSDIYLYMAKNGQRIASRLFLRGQFVAGSPMLGNGVWRRIWVDSYGFPLEASFAQVWTAKVTRDQNLGVFANNEIWDLMPYPFIDNVEWGVSGRGSGTTISCKTLNSDDTILNNASFSDRSGTDALPTAISFWTSSVAVIGDGSDYQIDRTNYYYAGQKEGGSPASLRVYLTRTLSQALSVANIPILLNSPYYTAIMANGVPGTWIGTVQFSWGSQSCVATVYGVAPTFVVGGAGSVTAGTHTYVATAVVNGVESGYSPASGIATAAPSQITVTVPFGPTGTTARNVYRTVAGNTGPYKLVGTIGDNVTATLVDNIADGSLGAAVATAAQSSWVRVEPSNFSTTSAAWPRNFQQQGGNTIAVTCTKAASSPGGSWVNIDATQFFPLYPVDGIFEAPIAGSLAFVNEDTGTITDVEQGAAPATGTAAGILQDWQHRASFGSLPSAPYSPVAANCTGGVAAPVIAQSATAGVVTAGAHLVGMTFVDQNGNESGLSVLSNSVTQSDSLHALDVTTIPTHLGTRGVIASRKLYMNKAGTGSGGTFYFTGVTINDNTTTTATGANGISISDANLQLNAVAPTGVTITEPS